MGWTKLYSLADSSIMEEDVVTRWIWVFMLSQANFNGFFDGSLPSLARRANVSKEDMGRALELFQNPDKESKSKAEEGRRIIYQGANRWWIVNYVEYRTKNEDPDSYRQYQWRMRKAKQRALEKGEEWDLSEWSRRDSVEQGTKSNDDGDVTGRHDYTDTDADADTSVCGNSSNTSGNNTGITEATPKRVPVSKNPPTVAEVHEQILSRGVKANDVSLRLAKQIVDHHESGGNWKTAAGKPIYVWKSHVNQWVERRLGGAGQPGRLTPDVKQMFRDQDTAKAHEKKLVENGRIKR